MVLIDLHRVDSGGGGRSVATFVNEFRTGRAGRVVGLVSGAAGDACHGRVGTGRALFTGGVGAGVFLGGLWCGAHSTCRELGFAHGGWMTVTLAVFTLCSGAVFDVGFQPVSAIADVEVAGSQFGEGDVANEGDDDGGGGFVGTLGFSRQPAWCLAHLDGRVGCLDFSSDSGYVGCGR